MSEESFRFDVSGICHEKARSRNCKCELKEFLPFVFRFNVVDNLFSLCLANINESRVIERKSLRFKVK